MVQQIRQGEPQYICVVPIESITGNQEEEIMAFGVSVEDAKHQAKQLLENDYRCDESKILELMHIARIEPIAQWCAPNSDNSVT